MTMYVWELCKGTLSVDFYVTGNRGERRVSISNRLLGPGDGGSLDLSWEQWEDLKEAIDNRPSED
jgi:hypothetical protein